MITLEQLAPNLIQEAPISWLIIERESKTITFCSQELLNLTGYEESEIIGSTLHKLLPEYVRPYHDKLVESFFANPSTRTMGKAKTLSIINKFQEDIPVQIAIAPVNGKGLYAAAYIFDISDITRVNGELETSREELQIINEQLAEANSRQAQTITELTQRANSKRQDQTLDYALKGAGLIILSIVILYVLSSFFPKGNESILSLLTYVITTFVGAIVSSVANVMGSKKEQDDTKPVNETDPLY